MPLCVVPLLRNLTPQAKFATISMFTIGTAVIAGENTLYRFHRPYLVEEAYRAKLEKSWADWAFDHRLPIVAGTFASTVAIGALWMAKNSPHQTGTQKILSLRLYGQAAGFAALFGTLAIGIVTAQSQRNQKKAGEEYQEPKSQ